MAGIDLQFRSTHERIMLLMLIGVVWWATLEAWRPWNTHLSVPVASCESSPPSLLLQPPAPKSASEVPSRHHWSAWRSRARGEGVVLVARTPVPLLSTVIPWKPVDCGVEGWGCYRSEESEKMEWEVVEVVVVDDFMLDFPVVLLPTESWRLAGIDTARWWHDAGYAVARLSGSSRSNEPEAVAVASRPPVRLSSPPALVRPPLVSKETDRLAMAFPLVPPQATPPLAAPLDSPGFQDRIIEAMRPYGAESLGHSLRRPMFVNPASLVAQLQDLSYEPEATLWVAHSLQLIESLSVESDSALQLTGELLAQLAHQANRAEELATKADRVGDSGLATRLRRARYAMWRRVDCWQAVDSLLAPSPDCLTLATVGLRSDEKGTVAHAAQQQEPVRIAELLARVEAYEATGNERNGQVIADQITQLSSSPDIRRRQIGELMEAHYRNANARVAITQEMLQRFLPDEAPRSEPVRERILGTPVRGYATTLSQKTIALVPDSSAWRFDILLQGEAKSKTQAFDRSVRVKTVGTTRFEAKQQLVIDSLGITPGAVVATADSQSRFVGASSKYDSMPLVGRMVRSRASDVFASRRAQAQKEVSGKAARRVEAEMAQAVEEATLRAEAKLHARLIEPLAECGITLEPIEMGTTEKRIFARIRIAQQNGLTAHTPRPRAPSDSLASLQLHESSLSNLAGGLKLAGQRLSAKELVTRFGKLSRRDASAKGASDVGDAEIEFASSQPIGVKLAEGRAKLTLSVRELVVRGRSNRNFKVHVYFKPETDRLQARFVHSEGPYFEGRLRNFDRIRLQTIFGKVFPPESSFTVGQALADDPRLKGLMITQMVIDDGWLGLALGPERTKRTAQLDRYAPLRY